MDFIESLYRVCFWRTAVIPPLAQSVFRRKFRMSHKWIAAVLKYNLNRSVPYVCDIYLIRWWRLIWCRLLRSRNIGDEPKLSNQCCRCTTMKKCSLFFLYIVIHNLNRSMMMNLANGFILFQYHVTFEPNDNDGLNTFLKQSKFKRNLRKFVKILEISAHCKTYVLIQIVCALWNTALF